MISMTEKEQDLILTHLTLVESLIYQVGYQKGVVGMEFEDLYQIGCIALCKAAAHYRPDRGATFKTYACRVIRNMLQDHREHASYIQSRLCYLDSLLSSDEGESYLDIIHDSQEPDAYLSEKELLELLNRAKSNYNGITKKGIEAIALKYQGYSNVEIANLYHVKANHISAWISRARSRLKADYPLTDLCYS